MCQIARVDHRSDLQALCHGDRRASHRVKIESVKLKLLRKTETECIGVVDSGFCVELRSWKRRELDQKKRDSGMTLKKCKGQFCRPKNLEARLEKNDNVTGVRLRREFEVQ